MDGDNMACRVADWPLIVGLVEIRYNDKADRRMNSVNLIRLVK